MQTLFSRILALWLSLLLPLIGQYSGAKDAGAPYAADDPEKVLLNVAVVSDLHADGFAPHQNNIMLMKTFSGISKSETPVDALVVPGDLTQTAATKEYLTLSALLKSYNTVDTVLPALGNHDVRGNMAVKDYEKNMRSYYAFCDSVGVQTDKPYWSQTINGFTFIVLGSEDEVKDSAFISPMQLLWLEETLTLAEKTGRPVFVICHQPLAHTNNVDKAWPDAGTVGEQSDALETIVEKHASAGLPVFWISGHLHADFNEHSMEKTHENFYSLNMPTAKKGGKGMMLEVYADRVLLRTRDFISGEWLDTYTITL